MKIMIEEHGGIVVSVIVSVLLLGTAVMWGRQIADFLQKFVFSIIGGG